MQSLTVCGQETGIGNLKGLGVLDYITKPFENDELVKRIKKALT